MDEKITKTIALAVGVGCGIIFLTAHAILNTYIEPSYAYETQEEEKNTNNETEETNEENTLTEEFIHINFSEYLELIKGDKPIFVYIGRDTCGGCQNFIPVLNEIKNVYPKIDIYHIPTSEIDFESDEYTEFEARNEMISEAFEYIPIIVITNNDQVLYASNGYKSFEEIEELLINYNILEG